MTTRDIASQDIASTLKTKNNLNFYEYYYRINTSNLAKALNDILTDGNEIKELKTNELYKQNMLDMAQFVYSKYLSERKEQKPAAHQASKKVTLLSNASLQTLYSFAI